MIIQSLLRSASSIGPVVLHPPCSIHHLDKDLKGALPLVWHKFDQLLIAEGYTFEEVRRAFGNPL